MRFQVLIPPLFGGERFQAHRALERLDIVVRPLVHPHRIPRLKPLPANRTLVVEVVGVHQPMPSQVPLTCKSLAASVTL